MRTTCARTRSTVMSRLSSTRAASPSSSREQAEKDVLGTDVVVLERARLFLRKDHYLPGPFCESLEHY